MIRVSPVSFQQTGVRISPSDATTDIDLNFVPYGPGRWPEVFARQRNRMNVGRQSLAF
jgi:hypothetical protein